MMNSFQEGNLMADEQWKEGDVVMLKSGGPLMTVTSIASGGAVHCTWFDGTKKMNGSFPAGTIERYQEPS